MRLDQPELRGQRGQQLVPRQLDRHPVGTAVVGTPEHTELAENEPAAAFRETHRE
ncbi:MAG: hypothetical protein AB7N53_15890 [Candidatus Binatia bacterium]